MEAKKAAEEAEERRLAEIRSLGTPVTPEHFATWKKRFYAEMALIRSRCGDLWGKTHIYTTCSDLMAFSMAEDCDIFHSQ